jgi:hypothetical protein
MALTSALTAASAFGDTTALIMGGTALPDPPALWTQPINDLYLHCDPPACTLQPLTTPEQFFPFYGGLTYDASVAQGATDLNDAIKDQLAAGNDVTVLGYSESSSVASLEMQNLVNGSAGIQPDADQLNFVLLGDPNNPNGGILERFDYPAGSNPTVPGLGITFGNPTPVSEYPTAIYTAEYDPIGDSPLYSINSLAELNAFLGFFFVHLQYPSFTPEQLASAVEVPTSAGYDGDTTYYMIPEDLPLLDPLRSIPVLGPLAADLIQPDLEVLVNLGYGDPEYGWVNEDADVPTPFGLYPSLSDMEKVPGLLVTGTEQGFDNVISDLEDPSQLFDLADNPLLHLVLNPYVLAVESSLLNLVGL